MKKYLALATAFALFGCGSSNFDFNTGFNNPPNSPSGPGPLPNPEFGPLFGNFSTFFLQNIPTARPQRPSAFVGSAHFWDLNRDFSIEDGFGDVFDGALEVSLGVNGGTLERFPQDQTYAELRYFAPTLTQADGLASAAVADTSVAPPLEGDFSAYLAIGNVTALAQTVDLTGLSAPVNISWQHSVATNSEGFIPGGPTGQFRVVARDLNGNLLQTLQVSAPGSGAQSPSVSADALAGQRFVLSFEAEGFGSVDFNFNFSPRRTFAAAVDNVSVTANGGNNLLVNPRFESGLTGWTAGAANTSQHVRSGSRTLQGMNVTRSWFFLPGQRWARSIDSVTNPGNTAANVTLQYAVDLGTDSSGTKVDRVPQSDERAWTNVDQSGSDDDSGLVCGSVNYALPTGDVVSGNITFTLQPGQTRSVAQFLLMDVDASGAGNLAATLNPLALQILSTLDTDARFFRGLTQQERQAIVNL